MIEKILQKMANQNRILNFITTVVIGSGLFSFMPTMAQSDSAIQELTFIELSSQIKNGHPLLISAELADDLGRANLLAKRGAFDPQIDASRRGKDFVSKNYYLGENYELFVPVRGPLNIVVGSERGQGDFLSPENQTLSKQLQYVGVEVPLLRGLLTDLRRTELRKAFLGREQSFLERRIEILNLAQLIWTDYINWLISYEQYRSYQTGVSLSENRQKALKSLFQAGGCNGMDTLENHIQYQMFKANADLWFANTNKARLTLSRHLWAVDKVNEDGAFLRPLVIDPSIVPTQTGLDYLDSLFNTEFSFNKNFTEIPDLNWYLFEIDKKSLDVKLKRQYLLPYANLKYQTLASGDWNFALSSGNQRFGIGVSSPLFLREARGNYQMSKIELTRSQMGFKFKAHELQTKIEAMQKQTNIYRSVYYQLKDIEEGYQTLYQMELEKFNSGDGTIFLLNTRENRYLTARIKTLEQKSKYFDSLIEYLRITGLINQGLF